MIGGQQHRGAHSAVKIAPQYRETVIHVNDASSCNGCWKFVKQG
jgi:5-methyltetrahydrofolate--homocysteine methyltransferase